MLAIFLLAANQENGASFEVALQIQGSGALLSERFCGGGVYSQNTIFPVRLSRFPACSVILFWKSQTVYGISLGHRGQWGLQCRAHGIQDLRGHKG